jgi:hypothetical protein
MSAAAPRQLNFSLLVAIAWLLVVLQLQLQYWPETAVTLNDTDDAMRLVQVREFLGGHGWFDLHMVRLQPPLGYDPHWSRLIDAGLAGVFTLFHHFTDAAFAERLMRAIWPELWLLPAIGGVSAIAWRMAGREAAIVVLLFAVLGMPAMQQFKPGRIHHHNVQIAIAVLAVAATAWSDRLRWAAMAAGILTGLGLAIGFECMPFLVLCGAVITIRAIQDHEAAGSMRAYGFSVAASTIGAFLVSVGPDHWARTACDSIAINSATAVVLGGLGLAMITYSRDPRTPVRCGLIAAVMVVTALVFVLSEPRCLGGPYAMVDPAVKLLWLADVLEMQPLLSVLKTSPATGLWLSTFPAVAIIAVIFLGLRDVLRRDFGFLVASAALLLAVAMMLAVIKGYPYAMWLAMPLIAVVALRMFAVLRLKSLVPRFIAGLLLTPVALSGGAVAIANAAGLDLHAWSNVLERQACFETQSYAPLARLHPGLVVTDIDYGPFVLALTPQSVLAAPYHRLLAGIIVTHKIFAVPPEEAYRIITRLRVNYVAMCGLLTPVGLTDQQRAASLWGQLQAGAVPDWLKREPAADGQAFAIYRVKS